MSAPSTGPGQVMAEAALAVVGVPFRLHGRGLDGLDCVGLVAWALRGGGWDGVVPTGYRLRGGERAVVSALIVAGLVRADGEAPGDVLLMRTGPGQVHLGVRVPNGLVHADAGLGRVVMRPGCVPWVVIGAWRLNEGLALGPHPAACGGCPSPASGRG